MITFAITNKNAVAFADTARSGIPYRCPFCDTSMVRVEKDDLCFFRLKAGQKHKKNDCTIREENQKIHAVSKLVMSDFIDSLKLPSSTQKPGSDGDGDPDIDTDGGEAQTTGSDEGGEMPPELGGDSGATPGPDSEKKPTRIVHKQIKTLSQLSECGLDDLFSNDVRLNGCKLSDYISTYASINSNPAYVAALDNRRKFKHIFEAKPKSSDFDKLQIRLYFGYNIDKKREWRSLLLSFHNEDVFKAVFYDLFIRTENNGKTEWTPKDEVYSVLVASAWTTMNDKNGFMCFIDSKQQVFAKLKNRS